MTNADAGDDSTVLVSHERDGAVRHIVLNRPEKRNALSRAMFETLIAEFTRQPEAAERVVLLSSTGPVFCAGVDLGDRRDDASAEANPLEVLCEAVRAYPLPVVAAIQGAAVAGGLMIPLHADFTIAVEDAKLGNGAVQMGMVPPRALARRLIDCTGLALGRELLLLGDLVPARRFAAAGAITAAVPPDSLDAAVDAVVGRLARNAPLSLRAIKATVNARTLYGRDADVDAGIAHAATSADAREGALARRERREPAFTGR